jgi:8-oxo-dGTP diphosphatase
MTDPGSKQIGIAVVEYEGRYLVGTRLAGQDLPGLAEFPGGKCEAGESPEACAVRECLEETDLKVKPVRLLERKRHEYAHAVVDLHFWLCRVDGEREGDANAPPQPGNGFQWKSVDELRSLSFPEANAGILKVLMH